MSIKIASHLRLCAVVVVLLAVMVGCGKHRSAKAGLDGHWVASDRQQAGEIYDIRINGTQLEYHGAQSNDWCRGTYVLNTNVEPAQMDLTISEPSQIAGKTVLVIYELRGDKMKMARSKAGNNQRPAGFTPNNETWVVLFKRE